MLPKCRNFKNYYGSQKLKLMFTVLLIFANLNSFKILFPVFPYPQSACKVMLINLSLGYTSCFTYFLIQSSQNIAVGMFSERVAVPTNVISRKPLFLYCPSTRCMFAYLRILFEKIRKSTENWLNLEMK
jgi:hypothetical protein